MIVRLMTYDIKLHTSNFNEVVYSIFISMDETTRVSEQATGSERKTSPVSKTVIQRACEISKEKPTYPRDRGIIYYFVNLLTYLSIYRI